MATEYMIYNLCPDSRTKWAFDASKRLCFEPYFTADVMLLELFYYVRGEWTGGVPALRLRGLRYFSLPHSDNTVRDFVAGRFSK